MNRNSRTTVLGLPGLYQNWLLSALDASAVSAPDKDHNFITHTHASTWIKKMDLDLTTISKLSQSTQVINCYVNDQHLVWYLYNFLEKTDGIGISVTTLAQDLFTLAPGTMAFDGLLKHLINEYKLTPEHNYTYKLNAVIENFYLLLIDQTSRFKQQTQFKSNTLINLEFRDFEKYDVLVSKLQQIPEFNILHFKNRYDQLVLRNAKYLDRSKIFLSKLDSYANQFDALETAYLGWLLWNIRPERQDWFNPLTRETLLKNNWNAICNLANMCYNKINDSN
jgi:hypothetical protein